VACDNIGTPYMAMYSHSSMLSAMCSGDGLDRLREEFPGWRFGFAWTTAASGPDRCRLWARCGDAFVSNWDMGGLRAAVIAEQRRFGDTP
jgi:hypothetical protein